MTSIKRVRHAALAFVCLLSLGFAAHGQTTTITASHLDMGPYSVSMGAVVITPVDSQGNPIAFSDGAGAQHGPTAFECQIVTGAITGAISETGAVSGSCTVPDATETIPANILYSMQVCDQSTGLRTSGQCYTLPQVVGVSGATWALDHYGPPATTTNVAALQSAQGATLPTSCTSPSVFTLLSDVGAFQGFYTCVGGDEVAVNGIAGATGATGAAGVTGTAATVNVGTTTTLAAGSAATVTNTGTTAAAILNFGIPQGAAGSAGGGGNSITPATSYIAFGDSITCGWIATQGNAAGSVAPYSIDDPGCNQANGYPYLIRNQLGLPTLNYAIPSDLAEDMWVRQIAPQGVSPTIANAPVYTVMIGTNDALAKGVGAYEVNFNTTLKAVLTWLAIPAEYKTLPAAATLSGGFSLASSTAFGPYLAASAAGSASFSITTYGGPIYLWYGISDSAAGVASYTVDGGAPVSFSALNTTPLSTQNGTTASVALARIAGVSAGSHTFSVAWTSGTVKVLGIGTVPGNVYYGHPTVVDLNIPLPESGTSYATGSYAASRIEYDADITADVTLLSGDGLDIRESLSDAYLTGATAQYTDGVHVTPLGAQALASAALRTLQPTPIVPVRTASLVTSGTISSITGGAVSGTSGFTDVGFLGDGTVSHAGAIDFMIPLTASGSLAAITTNVYAMAPGGSFDVLIMTCSACTGGASGAVTVVDRFTITPAATGLQTFYAGRDFTSVAVTSGQWIGVYQNKVGIGYTNVSPAAGLYYTAATNPSTGTVFIDQPTLTADFAANVGGTVSGSAASATDVVSVLGMTSAGHCAPPAPTNSSAASNQTTTPAYVSAKSSGQVTVTHAAVIGMAYDITCTAF